MQTEALKLKQASAVLGMSAKDLQNFVQFGVVKPKRRAGLYWFDANVLLQAKIGWYLRQSLGVSTSYLVRLVQIASKATASGRKYRQVICLRSRPARAATAIEIKIPVQSLAEEIAERLPLAGIYRDRLRGRRRSGWKPEFLHALNEAAAELNEVNEEDIVQAVKSQRKAARSEPEITVAREAKNATA